MTVKSSVSFFPMLHLYAPRGRQRLHTQHSWTAMLGFQTQSRIFIRVTEKILACVSLTHALQLKSKGLHDMCGRLGPIFHILTGDRLVLAYQLPAKRIAQITLQYLSMLSYSI